MAKRDIFGELMEGAAAMKSHREAKLTLRSYKVATAPFPKLIPSFIRDTRKRLRCHEQCSHGDCASTKELWKNGNKAVRSRIPRRRLSSFLSAKMADPTAYALRSELVLHGTP